MHYRFEITPYGPVTLEPVIPIGMEQYRIASAQPYSFSKGYSKVMVQVLRGIRVELYHYVYRPERKMQIRVTATKPLLQVAITLDNLFTGTLHGKGKYKIGAPCFNIAWLPVMDALVELEKGKDYIGCNLYFPVETIEQLAPFFEPVNSLLQKIKGNQVAFLLPEFMPVPDKIISLLYETIYQLQPQLSLPLFYDHRFTEILRLLLEEATQQKNTPQKNQLLSAVFEARRLVDLNFARIYTVQQLAREVGVSPSSLKKMFKVTFDRSILEYMQEKRIREAKALLKDPNVQVKEIAISLGFRRPDSFTAAFKKATGMTPREWRKKNT